jgi:hypothetical protein
MTGPTAQPPTAWPAQITGANAGIAQAADQTAGDRCVEIIDITAFARVAPHAVDNNQSAQDITITVTNKNTEVLKEVRVRVPTAFTFMTAGGAVVSGGRIWNVTFSTPLVVLTANSVADDIPLDGTIQITINCATQNMPAITTWPTTVVGLNGGTSSAAEETPGDLTIEIVQMRATAAVTPHTIYTHHQNQVVTYEIIASSGTAGMKQFDITVPAGFTMAGLDTIRRDLRRRESNVHLPGEHPGRPPAAGALGLPGDEYQ